MQAPPLKTTLDPVTLTQGELMWYSHGQVETWYDRRYYYDCLERPGLAHVVLQLTLQGTAFYEDAQGRQLVRQGQAFLNHIPGPFQYGYAGDHIGIMGDPYKLVYMTLVGSECRKWANLITSQFGNVLTLGLGSPVHNMMMAMVRQPSGRTRTGSRKNGVDRYHVSGQIYQLFMAIFSQLSQSRIDQAPRIADAVSLIQQQALDPLFNVQSLASQMQCSREYLSRQFRHALGVSPSEAIIARRLETACTLMRQSQDKLVNIAHASGFSSANYFCRTFRQHYGVTPNQYRSEPEMILLQRR